MANLPDGGVTVTIETLINGTHVPLDGWTITGTSHGHGGSTTINTTTTALKQANIDLVAMAVSAGAKGMTVDIYTTILSQRHHVFGGQYVKATFDYDSDNVTIHCRDWTTVLQDKQNVFNTQNRTLGQVWGDISNTYGLNPDVSVLNDDDPDIGSIYGPPDTAWSPVPQTPWSLIHKLARNNGYEAYVSPDKKLILGSPGSGEALKLCYQVNPVPDGYLPCRTLKFDHNPQRNANFKVKVRSYDRHAAQITNGEAEFGDPGDEGPPYQYHIDGLTADQAQQKANAITADIGRHEFLMTCELDFLPTLTPLQPVTIMSPVVNPIFTAQTYSVGKYSHRLRMPTGNSQVATLDTEIQHERPTKGRRGTAGQDTTPQD